MNGRLLAAAGLAVLAIGAGAWLLLGRGSGPGAGGPESGGTGPGAAGGTGDAKPGEAAKAEGPGEAPVVPGVLEGLVLRDGRPAAGRVAAWLLAKGPADPASPEAWGNFDPSDAVFDAFVPGPRGTAEAGADGKWEMRGLGPGWYLFEAVAPDGARGRATEGLGPAGTVPLAPGAFPRPVTVVLGPAGCTLRGRAFHADGTPFAGFAGVHRVGTNAVLGVPVPTDAEGRFRLEGLPRSLVRLFAADPGRRVVRGPAVLLPTEEEVALPVDAGLKEVEGKVLETPGDRPVPGAVVTATLDTWEEVYGDRATSDAEGRWRLRVPEGMGLFFTVRAKGFTVLETGVECPPGRGGPELEFRVERLGGLAGRVMDAASGNPVPGASVVLARFADTDSFDTGSFSRTRSDAEGRYAFASLPPGRAAVLAAGAGRLSRGLDPAGGWSEKGEMLVTIPPGGTVEKDIPVVPSPRARGRVADAAGRGIPGVVVVPAPAGEEAGAEDEFLRGAGVEGEARTDAEGAFAIPALLPGVSYTFTAKRGDVPAAFAGPLLAVPGGEIEISLVLPAERTVEVRVVEESSGAPIPGAAVDVTGVVREVAKDLGPTWRTDASGVARAGPLPEGRLTLDASVHLDDERGSASGRAEVEPGSSGPVTVRILLSPPPTFPLEGRVLLPDGSAAEDILVHFRRFEEDLGSSDGYPQTDHRGRFRVGFEEPGEVEVLADATRDGRRFSGIGKAETGDAAFVLTLEDGGTMEEEEGGPAAELRVLGPDGAPVPRASAAFRFLGPDGEPADYDEREVRDGRCAGRLPDPEDAPRFRVEVWGAADADGRPLGLGDGVFGPFATAPGETEVRLPAGRTVEGRVVAPDGNGVPGVAVSAVPVLDPAIEDVHGRMHATTGADGAFTLEGLADREYRLDFDPPRWAVPVDPVPVRGGARGVLVALKEGEAVRVRVLDADGKPAPGAWVRATIGEETRTGWQGTANASGVARLTGLPGGSVADLWVRPPDGREDLLPLEAEAWKPADGDVRLPRGYVLEVAVQDPAGRPVPGAWVEGGREGEEEFEESERTGGTGIARFTRLAPGRMRFRARLMESLERGKGSPETTAPTGAGRIVLTLDTGGEIRLRLKDRPGVRAWVKAAVAGEPEPSLRANLRGGEEEVLRGIPPAGRCDVYASDQKSRCAVLRGLAPGGPAHEVVLAPGKEIRGRVLLPEDAGRRWLTVLVGEAGLIGPASIGDDGSFVIEGVPEGKWKVRLRVVLNGGEVPEDGKPAERVVVVEAEAGGTVEIDAR